MIKTIIGLIFLLSPFLLMHKFKDKKSAFIYILSFLISFHLFIAIITQAFHIFTYYTILIINIIVFLVIILNINFKRISLSLKNIKAIDFILIYILIISFIYLFSVHYNYSGKYTIATTPYYQEAENMRYPYPYFADEWYAISFIDYSINYNSLPLKNPLQQYMPFLNLEFPFHSFLSELFLLLDLNPLTNYTVLTIFFGLLICILIYLFLIFNNINRFSAAIVSLSTLYITNGANLPGIWTLIPLNMGIISFLLSLFFIFSNKKMFFFMIFVTLLFYPPLFIFYTVIIITLFIIPKKISIKEKIEYIFFYLIVIFTVAIIISLSYFLGYYPDESLIHYVIFKNIFYPMLNPGFIPQYKIFSIIPLPILILSILGIISTIKRKTWLVTPIIIGLIYWIIYPFTTYRFIIEYERVVVFTSILIIVMAGFGLNYLIKFLKQINLFEKRNILSYIQIIILLSFIIFYFNYTQRDNWQALTLKNYETGQTFAPAAPANQYLHPDDLTLFKNIKNKIFLSLPWKGTVIGIATNNYPVNTKPGTITIYPHLQLFIEFMRIDCYWKDVVGERLFIDYVYTPQFNCSNFELIDISSEGLYLYKFINPIDNSTNNLS